MIVTHVVAGLSASDGGPSYSVPALCRALGERAVEAGIRTVADARGLSDAAAALPQRPLEHAAGRLTGALLRGSPDLLAALTADAERGAILHTHGVWLLPNLYPAWIKARRPGTPVVHSPRGMLSPVALAISPWRKAVLWRLAQRRAVEQADCLHATAPSELDELRALGLVNPVAVIPNGIDIPPTRRPPPATAPRERTVLSLGRIHPKKALPSLLRAWAKVEATHPHWRLRIAGPDEGGHAAELAALARSLGLQRATVEGPVYGQDKAAAYAGADLFVLSTLNENFGIAVAEALAAEVPVISTKGAPWSGLVQERCGWWIDHGPEALARSLQEAMALDDANRAAMGERGRAWMQRTFSWNRVADDMHALYRWLRHEGPRPDFVQDDGDRQA